MTIKLITIYLMSLFYIFAGVQHFVNTDWYLKIIPPYIPYHTAMVYISGVFEIILGIMLLFEDTRFLAGCFFLDKYDKHDFPTYVPPLGQRQLSTGSTPRASPRTCHIG